MRANFQRGNLKLVCNFRRANSTEVLPKIRTQFFAS
nr:MAG TPA: 54S ribosomal protein L8 [Caudoviricetes sp.]